MINLPPVLDFEASSLSDISYPITAGLVVHGKSYYWIIKPQPDWVDWSLASQAIHGIKRSYLMEHGSKVAQVSSEFRAALQSVSCLYSDNPYWEKRWLACLGSFDVEIRNIRELLPSHTHDQWHACLEHQFVAERLTRHRADHDAYAIALTVHQLQKISGAG